MHPSNLTDLVARTRRNFLATSASGVGTLALANLLRGEGLLGAEGPRPGHLNPLAPRAPHFAPKAKNCIFLFMAGAPSQLDLFDPKPKLDELHGKPLPESLTKDVRFAFIKKKDRRADEEPPQVQPPRAMRNGTLRFSAAHRHLR
ncbi:MAG: DUF1501 domain-containing protein [Planctomycetota bacterium]